MDRNLNFLEKKPRDNADYKQKLIAYLGKRKVADKKDTETLKVIIVDADHAHIHLIGVALARSLAHECRLNELFQTPIWDTDNKKPEMVLLVEKIQEDVFKECVELFKAGEKEFLNVKTHTYDLNITGMKFFENAKFKAAQKRMEKIIYPAGVRLGFKFSLIKLNQRNRKMKISVRFNWN